MFGDEEHGSHDLRIANGDIIPLCGPMHYSGGFVYSPLCSGQKSLITSFWFEIDSKFVLSSKMKS